MTYMYNVCPFTVSGVNMHFLSEGGAEEGLDAGFTFAYSMQMLWSTARLCQAVIQAYK